MNFTFITFYTVIGNIFIFFQVTLLFLQLILALAKILTFFKSKTVFKIYKFDWIYIIFSLSFFLLYWVIYRTYIAYINDNVINIWFLLKSIQSVFLEQSFFVLLVLFYCIIFGLLILQLVKLILAFYLKKLAYYLLQYPKFAKAIKKICCDIIYLKTLEFLSKILPYKSNVYNLRYKFCTAIERNYCRHEFTHFFMLLFFIVVLVDIFKNYGNLYFTSKVLPYFIIFLILQNIQLFLASKTITRIIISDIYYNFHNPRLEYMETVWTTLEIQLNGWKPISELHRDDLMPEEYMPEEYFYSSKYNLYRLYLEDDFGKIDYNLLINHVLTPDLLEDERTLRIKILKSIDKYPKSKGEAINVYPSKYDSFQYGGW